MKYVKQLLIAIDQLVNALLGGWSDETLSSRAYRNRMNTAFWFYLYCLIDCLFWFEKDHCRKSFESERDGLQLPPELRKKETSGT